MTIQQWVNFDGSLTGAGYTTGATEYPSGIVIGSIGGDGAISAPGAAWGTLNVVTGTYGIYMFDQQSQIPAASQTYPVRVAALVEPATLTAPAEVLNVWNGGVVTDNNDGTLTVSSTQNGETYSATITRPPGVYALEIVSDVTNATASERLKIRAWSLGNTPSAFTSAPQNFTSWTAPAAITNVRLVSYEYKYGQFIVSDDVTEDLSALIEQNDYSAGGDATPPILSNQTLTVNSNTAVTFGATSNEDGAGHAVVRLATDPAPTQQEIVDGTYANAVAVPADVTITANTAYSFAQVTGLTGNTTYAVDQVATDAAGNISSVNTQTFTTQSKALRLTLQGGASKTLNVVLFDAATESATAILKTLSNQVVAADGSITLDLNDTAVADGSAVEGLGKDAANGDPYPLQGTVTVQ